MTPDPGTADPSTARMRPVAASADVGAEPVKVWVDGSQWVLARLDGRVTKARDRCKHRC